jgi:DNA-binding response OmpR family regulator
MDTQGLPRILLVEPHAVLRGTVLGVVRELAQGDVQAVASVSSAERVMREERFDVVLLSLDGAPEAFGLLERLRGGALRGAEDALVAVSTAGCDTETAARLRALGVRRVLLKPFKVRLVVATIAGLCAAASAARAHGQCGLVGMGAESAA